MRARKATGMLVAAAVSAMGLAEEASAAKACADEYLLCLNEASQQEGWLYRTAREAECGLEYYACMSRKATGA